MNVIRRLILVATVVVLVGATAESAQSLTISVEPGDSPGTLEITLYRQFAFSTGGYSVRTESSVASDVVSLDIFSSSPPPGSLVTMSLVDLRERVTVATPKGDFVVQVQWFHDGDLIKTTNEEFSASVPEPTAGLLFGAGITLVGYTQRRRAVNSSAR